MRAVPERAAAGRARKATDVVDVTGVAKVVARVTGITARRKSLRVTAAGSAADARRSGDGPGATERTLFRVLFVCTGNICRSPMAERLLSSALNPGAVVVAESAGTRAMPGSSMTYQLANPT
jgi:hypothetical protein